MRRSVRLLPAGILEPRLEAFLVVVKCGDAALVRWRQSLLACVGRQQPFAAGGIFDGEQSFDPYQALARQRQHGLDPPVGFGEVLVIDTVSGIEPAVPRQFAGRP